MESLRASLRRLSPSSRQKSSPANVVSPFPSPTPEDKNRSATEQSNSLWKASPDVKALPLVARSLSTRDNSEEASYTTSVPNKMLQPDEVSEVIKGGHTKVRASLMRATHPLVVSISNTQTPTCTHARPSAHSLTL